MKTDINKLKERICNILCAEVTLVPQKNDLILVDTPFLFGDGDPYQIYLREMPSGLLRMSDCGHTFMHLSYDNDIDKFKEGTRNKILREIIADTGVQELGGEVFLDFQPDALGVSLFRFGQALTKINDLTFLNRVRVESTFYDDLFETLKKTISEDMIIKDYIYPNMPNAEDYPIDYKIEGRQLPLFLFGIPGRDKARLATIVLERLLRQTTQFDSILIFSDQTAIPRADLARLTNVGGEMVASLDAQEDLQRKLTRRSLH